MLMTQLKFIFASICMLSNLLAIQAQDTTPPTFQWLQIENDTLRNGDSVEIYVNAYDSLSGIQVIQLGYRNQFEETDFSLHYHSESYMDDNVYKLIYPISEWAARGKTIIESIVIQDNSDNLFISELYPIDSFFVISDAPDTSPPSLISISVNPDTVQTGEIVTTSMEIIDDVSGFLFCNFSLVDEENNLVEWFYGNYVNNRLVQIETNKYSLDITIPNWTKRGLHHFKIALFDRQNNGIEYNIQADNTVFFVNSNATSSGFPILSKEYFDIYPNPTNGLFHLVGINNKEVELRIISPDGKVVYYAVNKGDTVLDISNLPNGSYEIMIIDGEQILSKQIIKNGQ